MYLRLAPAGTPRSSPLLIQVAAASWIRSTICQRDDESVTDSFNSKLEDVITFQLLPCEVVYTHSGPHCDVFAIDCKPLLSRYEVRTSHKLQTKPLATTLITWPFLPRSQFLYGYHPNGSFYLPIFSLWAGGERVVSGWEA